MKYAEIFQLRIRHQYFSSGACPDLRITPFGETQAIISGHRFLLQTRPDRLVLLGELNSSGELRLPPVQGLQFRFALHPASERFFRYTQLPARAAGQLQFSNKGATELVPGQYRLAQSQQTDPRHSAWAIAEIEVNTEFSLPPQAGNRYDIEFEAIRTPWNVYLTTRQADDYLHIDGAGSGIYFYKLPLADLAQSQSGYSRVRDLELPQRWTGSDLNGLGLDFAVNSAGLQSQGPAGPSDLHAATPVAPVDGTSWRFRLEFPFAPDADNRFAAHFLASHPDPGHAEFTAYTLQLGDLGANRLRLIRRDAVHGDLEIASGSTSWTGNIDLEIAVTWQAGEWIVQANEPGQSASEEIRVSDHTLAPGGQLVFACSYDDLVRATQYAITSLEIRVPLGNTADIERKKAVANTLAELFPDKNQFLFASAGPVELKESPRKGISLKNGSSTLIEHMGNPSPDDNGTQFIHI